MKVLTTALHSPKQADEKWLQTLATFYNWYRQLLHHKHSVHTVAHLACKKVSVAAEQVLTLLFSTQHTFTLKTRIDWWILQCCQYHI